MAGKKRHIAWKVWIFAATITLFGCGGAAEDTGGAKSAISTDPIASGLYAGAMNIRISESISTKNGRNLPFALYLGFEPQIESRLAVNAAMDLREFQRELPEALSGRLDPDCGLGLDLNLADLVAEGDMVRAHGSVTASLFRCSGRDTEDERRGMRYLTQTIDAEALATAYLDGECIAFHLTELQLDPHGLLGGLANLFGITERARKTILDEAARVSAENPICPELPPIVRVLETDFAEGGLTEVGTGGLGASIRGSVNLASGNIVELLALLQKSGNGPGASAAFHASGRGQQVTFRIDETLPVGEKALPYGLDLQLFPSAPTRLGAEAVLDLRELQGQLPELLSNAVLIDNCGARVTLQGLEAKAEGANVIATGPLQLETFQCERTNPGTWERGDLQNKDRANVRFEMSAELVEQCVVFRLLDVSRDTPLPFAAVETEGGRTQAVKALLIEAIGLLLEDQPFCPAYPDWIDLLDPHFTRGTPEEIGNGGVGVALDGSVDLSSTTLIQMLSLLQKQGFLPAAP